jgi:mono/diheme cytochrome c family protein
MADCSGCHSAGTVDPGGSNLAGKQAKLTNNLGSISGAMSAITLTNQEILDLAAFLGTVK